MPEPLPAALLTLLGALVALAVHSFGGLRGVLDAYLERWRRRAGVGRGGGGVRLLHRLAELSAVIRESTKLATVGRALTFVGHNCGGLPTAGKRYVVRAQSGWDNRGGYVLERFAFDLEIDQPYADMLHRIQREGVVILDAATMEAGLLKRIYRREKVAHAALFALCHDAAANEFGYASFASYDGPISDDDLAALENVVARLRAMMVEE